MGCSNAGWYDHTEDACRCTRLYKGDKCQFSYELAPRPECMKTFQGRYQGGIAMSQINMRGRTQVSVARHPGLGAQKAEPTLVGKVTPRLLRSLPISDPLEAKLFRSCAVVGSSGILLMHRNGAEIDQADLVLRFNSAPTRGFEAYVGSRTTHRITNSRNFGFRESPDEVVIAHMRHPTAMENLIQTRLQNPELRLYGFHQDFHRYVDESFTFLATSGLFGILIALHKCLEVKLYGFHVHERHGVVYHYYNPEDKPANEGRDDVEWKVVEALSLHHLVEFAEPCVRECHVSELWCSSCQEIGSTATNQTARGPPAA